MYIYIYIYIRIYTYTHKHPSSLPPGCPETLAARHWSNSRDNRPEAKDIATTGVQNRVVHHCDICFEDSVIKSIHRITVDAASTI